MKKLEIYIVVHDKASFDLFCKNNSEFVDDVKFILVGQFADENWNTERIDIIARNYSNNMEYLPSLLTFTAWYCLIMNNLIQSNFIAVLEYDVVIKKDLNDLYDAILFPNFVFTEFYQIIGFTRRELPDAMFLQPIPEFVKLLLPIELKRADRFGFWTASTNLVMPVRFMFGFVHWFLQFIPNIINISNHPHFMERALNIYACNNGFRIETVKDFVIHNQLNSHKISL